MILPPEIEEALRSTPGGTAISVMEQPPDRAEQEAAIICKVPLTYAEWRAPGLLIKVEHLGYLYVPEGPVIRVLITIYDQPGNPLRLDTFLNPNNDADMEIMRQWAIQRRFVLHGFNSDPDLIYLGTKILAWNERNHVGINKVIERVSGIPVLWPDARDRCIEENPL